MERKLIGEFEVADNYFLYVYDDFTYSYSGYNIVNDQYERSYWSIRDNKVFFRHFVNESWRYADETELFTKCIRKSIKNHIDSSLEEIVLKPNEN